MSTKNSIVFFIAWRYLFPPKKRLSQSSHWVAIAGIAIGVTSLIGTLGVMNGLQQGYISSILEVGSYHARIHSRGFLPEETRQQILALPDVVTVEPMIESQGLLETIGGTFYAFFLRAMPMHAYINDPNLQKKLNIDNGNFPQPGQILLGQNLYDNLIWEEQNSVGLVALPKGQLRPFIQPLTISGTFQTGYYDYDRNMAIINLEDGLKYLTSEKEIFYGVKLKNLNHDQKFLKKMEILGLDVSSWREYNRAFLGALRLEKNMMTFLLCLIFVIVAVNIFQGRQREIEEKREEIAILRTIGAGEKTVRSIFILQGFIIGMIGAVLGFTCGVLITSQINNIFLILEKSINAILELFTRLGWGIYEPVSFVSGPNYYLNGLPILMKTHENLLFAIFAVLSAVLSALWASRYVSKLKPLEILKSH